MLEYILMESLTIWIQEDDSKSLKILHAMIWCKND